MLTHDAFTSRAKRRMMKNEMGMVFNKVFRLIHLYRVDSSTSYLRIGPFQVEGISSYFF